MAKLLEMLNPLQTDYVDRRFKGNENEYHTRLAASTTLYIGNLSFFTTEEQIYEVFSKSGDVKRIVMGLDRQKKTPCGFCFVVYYTQRDAKAAIKYLNGTMVDERPVRVDMDYGFEEGRQFGRGLSGGQVRDEFRTDFDEGRGGWGHQLATELSALPVAAAGGQAQFYGAGQRAPHGQGDGRGRQREGDEEGPGGVRAKRARVEERNPRYRDRGDDRDEDDEGGQAVDAGAGAASNEAAGGEADVGGDGGEASVGGGDGTEEQEQQQEEGGQDEEQQQDRQGVGTMEAEAY